MMHNVDDADAVTTCIRLMKKKCFEREKKCQRTETKKKGKNHKERE